MSRQIPIDNDSITIYDIAAMSGVSVSTVSRVINNGAHVSPKTREKVDEVIRRTGYSPSSVARALNSVGTKTLGVIISDITNPYFSTLYLEIQRYAVECGYSILLFNTFYGGSCHGVAGSISETQYFAILLDKKVDGVLILGGEVDKDSVSAEYLAGLQRLSAKVPVVVLGEEIPETGCSFISRHIGGGVSTVRRYLQAGLIDEMHLALSPTVLGQGEALFAGIDLPGLGFSVSEHVATELATHVVLRR